jgi:hypothetical protein
MIKIRKQSAAGMVPRGAFNPFSLTEKCAGLPDMSWGPLKDVLYGRPYPRLCDYNAWLLVRTDPSAVLMIMNWPEPRIFFPTTKLYPALPEESAVASHSLSPRFRDRLTLALLVVFSLRPSRMNDHGRPRPARHHSVLYIKHPCDSIADQA